ncbi:hypothetical protein [Gryllotalpicola protaetiae]|uniref:Uncharacterized protein n=1 Tax=Gryllotalpicola protaetiae TaxID=2419771 RepID=A0A387C0H7_9MICO|nr:hypothetical protein [Gryllotalpicola protaetiae]AYG04051.1 hypothetical protein D7I44_11275 [Gryllotalpicola protaetiae]
MLTQVELVGAPAELWLDERRLPERMVAGGHRWIVIDEPSVLDTVEPSPALTHRPAGVVPRTLRFTARSFDEGEALVFDVEREIGDHWVVRATYV